MSESENVSTADSDLPTHSKEWLAAAAADWELALKKAADFDMGRAIVALYWEEPFFASILCRVNRVATFTIPTAGVTAVGQELILLWNPIFFSELNPGQVMSVLRHECYHLCLQHIAIRRQDPPKVWNYSTDLAINSLIATGEQIDSKRALTPECLYPGRPLFIEQKVREKLMAKDPEGMARFDKLSDVIKGLQPQLSSEEYHRILLSDPNIEEIIKEGPFGKKGKGQPGGEQGQGGQPGEGKDPGPLDDHDGWDKITEDQREIMRSKLGQIMREAVKNADASNKWGSVPSEMRSKIRDMVSNEVDWRSVLRYFVGTSRRANRTNSMKKINRKYPYIHPGRKRGYTARVDIYMDNSGSVGDEDLALFFGELSGLSKKVDFRIYFFDTEVHDQEVLIWKKGQHVAPVRVKCGGTDFNAPTRHANNRDAENRPDAYIIMSDGECSKPDHSRIQRAYVICPNRKLLFEADEADVVIQMKRPVLIS